MRAIVQRAKNILYGGTTIDQGTIVFILDFSQIDWILEKVAKLKMWNNRKSNSSEMKAQIFLVLPNNIGQLEKERFCSQICPDIVIPNHIQLKYVNDGPCTFVLK